MPGCLAIAVFIGVLLVRTFLDTGSNVADLSVSFVAAIAIWFAGMLATSPGQRRIDYYRRSLIGTQPTHS
jgi:hypothetical protein